jgi:hypothetical protein
MKQVDKQFLDMLEKEGWSNLYTGPSIKNSELKERVEGKVNDYENCLLKQISFCLFDDNCVSVAINPKDYQKLMLTLNHHSGFEPETNRDLLLQGIVGYFAAQGEVAKPVYVSRQAEEGKVYGNKPYAILNL